MQYKIHASYMHSGASVLGFFFPLKCSGRAGRGHACAMAARSPGVTACMQPRSPQLLGAAQELWVPKSCLLGLLG